ncbi:MAG: serine hydrolase [Microgenomates group bacterium]|jgi:beta-lactamase class A
MKGFLFSIIGISIVINVLLIGFLFNAEDSSSNANRIEQLRDSLQFLSPRVFQENQNDLIINFVPLREQLQHYHSSVPERFGLYFEYLPTGNSIGVNEKDIFVPASLLKLPLAMGVFKLVEQKKISFDQTLTLTDVDKDPRFGDLWKQKSGTKYNIDDLIHSLIIYSDNTAQEMLLRLVTGQVIDDVFDNLDIPKTRNELSNPVVTSKNYSSILRCLYLSCYLTKEGSNHLLEHLTKTEFHDKLPAGVPNSIPIAHKIGVAEGKNNDKNIYTDCGIVYYPKRPYILCLMIQSNEEEARTVMKDISKITYNFIHTQD